MKFPIYNQPIGFIMFHSIIFLLNGDRYENISMANANRRGGGRYPIILAIFPRKSHKIEKLHGGRFSSSPGYAIACTQKQKRMVTELTNQHRLKCSLNYPIG